MGTGYMVLVRGKPTVGFGSAGVLGVRDMCRLQECKAVEARFDAEIARLQARPLHFRSPERARTGTPTSTQ